MLFPFSVHFYWVSHSYDFKFFNSFEYFGMIFRERDKSISSSFFLIFLFLFSRTFHNKVFSTHFCLEKCIAIQLMKGTFLMYKNSKTVMSFANDLNIFSNDAALYTNDIKRIFPVRNKRPTNNNEMVFVNKRSLFINIKCYALVSVLSLPQYYSEQFCFSAILCCAALVCRWWKWFCLSTT